VARPEVAFKALDVVPSVARSNNALSAAKLFKRVPADSGAPRVLFSTNFASCDSGRRSASTLADAGATDLQHDCEAVVQSPDHLRDKAAPSVPFEIDEGLRVRHAERPLNHREDLFEQRRRRVTAQARVPLSTSVEADPPQRSICPSLMKVGPGSSKDTPVAVELEHALANFAQWVFRQRAQERATPSRRTRSPSPWRMNTRLISWRRGKSRTALASRTTYFAFLISDAGAARLRIRQAARW
jgi:hypothetical protein